MTAPKEATAPLQFDKAAHRYTVAGVVYPGITQVIEAAGLVDYSKLDPADLEFYKHRGTAVHQACWFDDEGDLDEATVDPLVMPRLESWRKFRRDLPFTIEEGESPRCCHVNRYAGTPDRLVKLPDGSKGVVELKSGPLQPAVAVQLAAQSHLFDSRLTLKRFAVHLKGDCSYSLKEFHVSAARQDLAIFLSALTIQRWRNANL